MLRDRATLLSDVCSDGDTLVLLAGREPAAGPPRGGPVPKVRGRAVLESKQPVQLAAAS